MNLVHYQGRPYPVPPGTSVLDTLLQGGVDVTHSCKAGVCGSCMLRVTAGEIPERAQAGLRDSWKVQGYFLPCVCLPGSDLSVTPVNADDTHSAASIATIERLSPDVIRVRLSFDTPFSFRAGQYVTILRPGSGLARSYSIANLPCASPAAIEIHVRRIAGGRMSGWFHDSAAEGDRVEVLGPSGNCFYVPGNPEQPLVLAGTGTGLAPLYGILQDALDQQHTGPIHLFHGAVNESGLYLVDELQRVADAHSNVAYTPTVLNGSVDSSIEAGPLDQIILRRFPKLTGHRAFVCGDPSLVNLLKKKFFLAGAASRDIYADAFLPSPVT